MDRILGRPLCCSRSLLAITVSACLLVSVSSKTALIIVDVQNCFLPGGTLAVADGEHVIPVINNIRRKYDNQIALTVFTQDWHCADHVSFASQHVGNHVFDVISLQYDSEGQLCSDGAGLCNSVHVLNQTLWPDHCVINTTDAQFSTQITREPGDIVVRKGYHCNIDSYSGFYDNGGFSKTELESIFWQHDITTVVVTGLALDFCVYHTSIDAKRIGFDVYMVVDASEPVSSANVPRVLQDLRHRGVHVITSSQLENVISTASSPSVKLALQTLFVLTVLLLVQK